MLSLVKSVNADGDDVDETEADTAEAYRRDRCGGRRLGRARFFCCPTLLGFVGRNKTAPELQDSRFGQRCHVNDEAILHIALQHPLIGGVDLLDGNQLNIGDDAMFAAIIQHLLRFPGAAD